MTRFGAALAALCVALVPAATRAQVRPPQPTVPYVSGEFLVNVVLTCPTKLNLSLLAFQQSDTLSYPGMVDILPSPAGAIIHQLFSAKFATGRSGTYVIAGTQDDSSVVYKDQTQTTYGAGRPLETRPAIVLDTFKIEGSARTLGTITWKLPFTPKATTFTAYFTKINSANRASKFVFQGRTGFDLPMDPYPESNGCTAQGTAEQFEVAPLRGLPG